MLLCSLVLSPTWGCSAIPWQALSMCEELVSPWRPGDSHPSTWPACMAFFLHEHHVAAFGSDVHPHPQPHPHEHCSRSHYLIQMSSEEAVLPHMGSGKAEVFALSLSPEPSKTQEDAGCTAGSESRVD